MKIKTFLTSVGYDDYLHYTLPWNKGKCGDMTVISSASDRATQDVCARHGVRCFLAPRMPDGWKGWSIAYNDCLRAEEDLEWVLIMDADILLPADFASMVEQATLDPAALHYTSRVYLPMDYPRIDEHIAAACDGKPFLGRGWTHLPAQTWGYFMLFNWQKANLADKFFGENLNGQGHDIEYAGRFTRTLPLPMDFAVAHIPHGTWDDWSKNWSGRKTDRLIIRPA